MRWPSGSLWRRRVCGHEDVTRSAVVLRSARGFRTPTGPLRGAAGGGGAPTAPAGRPRRGDGAGVTYYENTTGMPVGEVEEGRRGYLGFGHRQGRAMPLNPLYSLKEKTTAGNRATERLLHAVDELNKGGSALGNPMRRPVARPSAAAAGHRRGSGGGETAADRGIAGTLRWILSRLSGLRRSGRRRASRPSPAHDVEREAHPSLYNFVVGPRDGAGEGGEAAGGALEEGGRIAKRNRWTSARQQRQAQQVVMQLSEEQQQELVNRFVDTRWYGRLWRPFRHISSTRIKWYRRALNALLTLLSLSGIGVLMYLYYAEVRTLEALSERDREDYIRLVNGMRYSEIYRMGEALLAKEDPNEALPMPQRYHLVIEEARRLGWTAIDWELEGRERYKSSPWDDADYMHAFYWATMYVGRAFSGGTTAYYNAFVDSATTRGGGAA